MCVCMHYSRVCLVSVLSSMAHSDVCLVLTHFRVSMVTVGHWPRAVSERQTHTTHCTRTSHRPDMCDAPSHFPSFCIIFHLSLRCAIQLISFLCIFQWLLCVFFLLCLWIPILVWLRYKWQDYASFHILPKCPWVWISELVIRSI